MLERFDTDNPYLQKLFAHDLFGTARDGSAALLTQLSTHVAEEQLISAMRVRHGMAQGGLLMLSTHWLRYVKQGRLLTVISNDDFWPLDGGLELEASLADGRSSAPPTATSSRSSRRFRSSPGARLRASSRSTSSRCWPASTSTGS
jgi:hypothetical protein